MTNILALDASTEHCSVALFIGDKVTGGTSDQIIEKVSDLPRSHADRLLPMVDQVLAEGQCSLQQLDAIAFGAGPGSFTGLRICIGIVQGLAFGADLPVVAVSSLEAMALMARERYADTNTSLIVPAIDARMQEIYWAAYSFSDVQPEIAVAPRVLPVAATDRELSSLLDGKDAIGVGSGWPLLQQGGVLLKYCENNFYPGASAIAKLGQVAYHAGASTDAIKAEPIYLRTGISWKKRERIRR